MKNNNWSLCNFVHYSSFCDFPSHKLNITVYCNTQSTFLMEFPPYYIEAKCVHKSGQFLHCISFVKKQRRSQRMYWLSCFAPVVQLSLSTYLPTISTYFTIELYRFNDKFKYNICVLYILRIYWVYIGQSPMPHEACLTPLPYFNFFSFSFDRRRRRRYCFCWFHFFSSFFFQHSFLYFVSF